MSTAVLEQPKEKEAAYKMPQPELGQLVMVYPGADGSGTNGVVGVVVRAYKETICANCFSQGDMATHSLNPVEQLRYVADPRLKNPHICTEGGAWDFTPRDKTLKQELDDLRETVQKLVNDLGGPSTKGRKGD